MRLSRSTVFFVIVALLSLTSRVYCADPIRNEWNSDYLLNNTFPDGTLVVSFGMGIAHDADYVDLFKNPDDYETKLTFYKDIQKTKPLLWNFWQGKDLTVHPLYENWSQDGICDFLFLVKQKKEGMVEVYIDAKSKETLWYALPQANELIKSGPFVNFYSLPRPKDKTKSNLVIDVKLKQFSDLYLSGTISGTEVESTEGDPAMGSSNIKLDLFEQPSDSDKVKTVCDTTLHGKADHLLLTGKRQKDWFEMECEERTCYAENSGEWWAGCESGESEAGTAAREKARATLPPCTKGWARWRSSDNKIIFRFANDPRKTCD